MNKVGRWFFLCFLIGVGCLLGFAYIIQSHLTDYFKQEKQQLMIAQVELAQSQIQDLIQQELVELGIWAKHPLVLEFVKKQIADSNSFKNNSLSLSEMNYFAFLIENGVLADPNYYNTLLYSPNGELMWMAESRNSNKLIQDDLFKRWMVKMNQGLSAALVIDDEQSFPQDTTQDVFLTIIFGVPLIEKGKVIAVLALELNAGPRIFNILKRARLSGEGGASLYTRYGGHVIHFNQSEVDKTLIQTQLLKNSVGDQAKTYQTEESILAWNWNQANQVGILISLPSEIVNSSLRRIQFGISVLVFVAVLVMLALLFVINVYQGKLKEKQNNIVRHRARLLHVQDLAQVACLEVTSQDQKVIWYSGFEFIYDFFPNEDNSPLSLLQKLSEQVRDDYFKALAKVKKCQTMEELEVSFTLADGQLKYILIKLFPQGVQEEPSVLILISDISEQKLKQREALQAEKEYRDLILESAHDGIVSVDLSGRTTLFNHASIAMLGYTESELLDLPIQSLIYNSEIAIRSQPMQVSGSAKVWLACRNGDRLPVDCRVSPIIQKGKPVGAVYLFRDISEQIKFEGKLKESEQRFRRVIEGTSDATFDWNMVKNELHWNARYWEMLGYGHEQANVYAQDNHYWQEMVIKEDLDKFVDAIQAHLIFTNQFDIEYRALNASNEVVWLRARGQAIKENNKYLYMSGTISDISQMKQAELEKGILEEQLRHSQKMEAIGQLTGGIAHDFNNILASVLGYAELISDMMELGKTAKIQPYVEQIISSGERARDLIKQMMVFSRKDAQVLKQVNIHELIDESLAIIRPLIPSSLEIKVSQNVHRVLEVNPVQFQQILMNLAINAKDSMSNVGTLTIATEKVDSLTLTCSSCHAVFSQKMIKISVKDTGTGIDKDTLKKVFDPYFTTKGLGEGSGMGLSIVHGIIHQLGGHLQVSSELGQGTQFDLYLPYHVDLNTEQSLEQRPLIDNKQPGSIKPHIFIVDDEISIAQLVSQKLSLKGYQTTVSTDSTKALALLTEQATEFDILITDQTMPVMSGLELSRSVLNILPNMPIILCSGYSDKVSETVVADNHLFAYLVKPIDFNQLLNLIEQASELLGKLQNEHIK